MAEYLAILERMEDHIQELLALGISTELKKGIKKLPLGRLDGRLEDYEKIDLGVI